MTMRTTMLSPRVGLSLDWGPQPPFQHRRGALRRRDWRPFRRLDKVVRCQRSGRIVQQAKMPQMLLSLRRCGAGSSQNSSRKRFARALKQYGTAC